jgi:DNA-binding transcriptional ArsR family regulator
MDEQGPRDRISALRAVAHPVRLRILSLLTGAEMSAAEIARELGIAHASASYHLRVLAEAGEVVEAGEEQIRGGVAKRYRHPWDQVNRTAHGASRGPGSRHDDQGLALYARALAEELGRRSALRLPGSRSVLVDAELWVPPETRDRARKLLLEASSLLHGAAQPPRTAGSVHVNLSAALFEMTDPPAAAPAETEEERG